MAIDLAQLLRANLQNACSNQVVAQQGHKTNQREAKSCCLSLSMLQLLQAAAVVAVSVLQVVQRMMWRLVVVVILPALVVLSAGLVVKPVVLQALL